MPVTGNGAGAGAGIAYRVVFRQASVESSGEVSGESSGEAFGEEGVKAVREALKKVSLLEKLASTPPDDRVGLEIRMRRDVEEARRLLQAYGYYRGTATAWAEGTALPLQVVLEIAPGPRYTLGPSRIQYRDAQGRAEDYPSGASWISGGEAGAGASEARVPHTLADVGLREGAPAVAGDILDAVERVPPILGERGYPLARVVLTRYVADASTDTLCASVLVDAGPRVRMGELRVEGESRVEHSYLHRLRPWATGVAWDQREVDQFRHILTQQGLFRSLRLTPVPVPVPVQAGEGDLPLYDVLVSIADAPQRTLGGGLRYESDRGPGVRAYWEDRNWLGSGERLRAEASLWQDSQTARLHFRKPAFGRREQSLSAEGWLRNESTDAYDQRALWGGAGLERRVAGGWVLSAGLSAEGGDLKDVLHDRTPYTLLGAPLSVRYVGTGNPLDIVRGIRGGVSVRPTLGQYREAFTTFPVRFDVNAYAPLFQRKDGSEGVVLAAHLAVGSLLRDDAQKMPASIRWYGGGGGSVRGYAYQSLGPRFRGDPLGGASFVEGSLEARVRITKDVAVVPFVDAGNVYADAMPPLGRDGLQWGAGLGLRYYTAIGPLRLDVATPLNPRHDDGRFFFYVSIGQTF